jgi:hypothetical protein
LAQYIHDFANGKAKAAAIKQKWSDPWATALALGLEGLRRSGERVYALCPWHDEQSPSCAIEPHQRGLVVHCYGCGHHGDVFDLAAAKLGVSTRGADFARVAEHLERLQHIAEPEPVTPVLSASTPRTTAIDAETFGVVIECVIDCCPVEREYDVAEYLSKRGILDEAVQARWAALPANEDQRCRVVDEVIATVGKKAWLASGIARPDYGLAFPDHRVLIPWFDPLGYPVNVQRRALVHSPAAPKYVSAMSRSFPWPYGIERLIDANSNAEVMFVEGAVDTLAVIAMTRGEVPGRVVLGLPGVSGWPAEWRFLCTERSSEIALDADPAGEQARDRVANDVRQVALKVRACRPASNFKDWAELLQHESGER